MNNEKGRAFLLCMIGLFVLFMLGWKHTETLSADDYVKESIGIVEISIVTPSPKYQQINKEEYINFDLRNLAIVKKDNEDETAGSDGLQSVGAGSEPDNEQYVEDGAGSAIDTQDPTGNEEDAEGTEGIGYSEGDTGLCDTDAWDSVESDTANGDGREESNLPELVGEGSNGVYEAGQPDKGWVYYGNCRITFYDCGSCCCGEYANGITANGDEAIVGWTVANGSLPFGTMVLIDGQEYCVTDRGVGEDQFDILVSSHDEAIQRGMYYADVYIKR